MGIWGIPLLGNYLASCFFAALLPFDPFVLLLALLVGGDEVMPPRHLYIARCLTSEYGSELGLFAELSFATCGPQLKAYNDQLSHMH